ncbi:SHOC2, partial [Symbiodinium pilosum]
DEDCLATGQDAGASWVQMKTTKVENAKAAKDVNDNGYYYYKRGGDLGGTNTITWSVPSDISNPSWVWENELDEQIRHSPLIDDKKNIYVAGTQRLRKFSPDGKLLWLFVQDEKSNTSPTMGNGVIYFRVGQGSGINRVYALSMESGEVLFNTTIAGFDYGPDSQSLLLAGGRLFLPALARALQGGCDSVIAVNSSNGEQLWSYTTDKVMWNFSPSTPDGGKSLTFSSTCGVFHKLNAEDGQLIFKTGYDGDVG